MKVGGGGGGVKLIIGVNKVMVVWCTQSLHGEGSISMWHQPCNNQTVL